MPAILDMNPGVTEQSANLSLQEASRSYLVSTLTDGAGMKWYPESARPTVACKGALVGGLQFYAFDRDQGCLSSTLMASQERE